MTSPESFIPSNEWLPDERIQVAATLVHKLKSQAAEGFVARDVVYDLTERVEFILTQSPAFLENNRRSILDGQPPANPPITLA